MEHGEMENEVSLGLALLNHAQHPTADDPRNHSAAIVEGTGNKCNGSLLLQHRDKLRRLSPDTEATRRVQNLVEARRKLVDEKTAQTNRLTSHLKIYFPQMLDWFERLDTGLVCALLERWPTLEELQKVPPAKLRMFFQKYHCRDHELIERRILAIRQAIPAIRDRAVIEADSALVKVIVQVIRSLVAGIATLDEKVEEAATAHPDFFIFDSLPGAGAALAPRLLAAFGSQRERYSNAGEVQSYSGIAPVMESSGKKQWVHFRVACPKFLRQSFHECAGHSIAYSVWARSYYQQLRSRGKGHHAAVRALAF